MILIKRKIIFMILVILSIVILISSLFDVFNEGQDVQIVLTIYAVLIIFAIMLLFFYPTKKIIGSKDIVEEFEKSLEGKLYHFKCPNCNGIFAIKKSKENNKKPFALTCPDCGTVGKISSSPTVIVEEIPKQKSENIKFKCKSCGERVSVWAEGAELYQNIQINSCPYCGKKQPMNSM